MGLLTKELLFIELFGKHSELRTLETRETIIKVMIAFYCYYYLETIKRERKENNVGYECGYNTQYMVIEWQRKWHLIKRQVS